MEIKKAAKEGNKEVCTILAKQLVQMRKAKTRAYAAKGKVFVTPIQHWDETAITTFLIGN